MMESPESDDVSSHKAKPSRAIVKWPEKAEDAPHAKRRPVEMRDVMKARRVPAVAAGAMAMGTLAAGALAVGAVTVGAMAIGALAIGRLAIRHARIRKLEVDELVIRKITRPE